MAMFVCRRIHVYNIHYHPTILHFRVSIVVFVGCTHDHLAMMKSIQVGKGEIVWDSYGGNDGIVAANSMILVR